MLTLCILAGLMPACRGADEAAGENAMAPGSYLVPSSGAPSPDFSRETTIPTSPAVTTEAEVPGQSFQGINGSPAFGPGFTAGQMTAPLQGGVSQRAYPAPALPTPPSVAPQYQNPLQSSPLQKALMPAWLPAYMQAMTAAMPPPDESDLQGQVEQNVTRPDWLPIEVYSHPSMVTEYHALDINPFDKRPIPSQPQWMRLSSSVLRYWRGPRIDPTFIYSIPDPQHPGSFTFTSNYRGGPKGWLQATGRSGRWDFPQYRYWFDPR
jgi:hypothetical protein